MDNIKGWITGGIITVIIGGTTYTFNQQDVAQNMIDDTGMTQEQAEQYVGSVQEEDLVSFDVLGSQLITEGQEFQAVAQGIDCVNYDYEWQSATLSCAQGKAQLQQFGTDTIVLGRAYQTLHTDTASESHIVETIKLIDALQPDFDFPIIQWMYTAADIAEMRNTNAYNKALLETTLQSAAQ